MTAPSTCLPRKSSADLRSDFRKIEVTSVTVKTLSASNGSDRGVGTCEAAGVAVADLGLAAGSGDGAGTRTDTL